MLRYLNLINVSLHKTEPENKQGEKLTFSKKWKISTMFVEEKVNGI